jgi:hypothetical protein
MDVTGFKPLSRLQTRALLKLYDKRTGTSYELEIAPRMLEILIRYGFAKKVKRRPRSFVGTTHTLYAITPLGERECYLTGKRHAV